MTPVVVLGTGGHARVCVDVLLTAGIPVLGCVGGEPVGPLEVPHLGPDEVLSDLARGTTSAFVAVGDNAVRQQLADMLTATGWSLVSAVHPAATVARTATVGSNVVVVAGAVVNPYATIGDGAIVNTGATIDHDCELGRFVHVAPGVHLAGNVIIGEGAFLGVGSSVIPTRRIGEWAVVGAGSVVVRNVAPHQTVYGSPAAPRTRKDR